MWLSGLYFSNRVHMTWKNARIQSKRNYMAHKMPMDCTQNALKIVLRFTSAVCHQSDMCAYKNECEFYSPFRSQFNFATTTIEKRTNALVASIGMKYSWNTRRIRAILALVRLTTLYICTVVRLQHCTNRILLPLTEPCPRTTHTIRVFI